MPTGSDSDTPPSQLTADELRAIFHTVNDAIFVHDTNGDIIEVNQTAAEMYGYSREEILEGNIETISSGIPPYIQENARKNVKRAVEGETVRSEWQGQTSDGEVFWEEVSLSRTTIDGDVRVIAIIRDIHDRKATERRYQTLIDNLPGMVYRCRNDSGWPMEFVSGECKQLTGYEADAFESSTVMWGDLIHPADKELVTQQVTTAVTNDEPFELRYRIRTAADETRWVRERGRQVKPAYVDREFLEGFITDITERKEYERELEEQRDNLEILNQVVRHDIRNDMTVVRGRANLLEEHIDREDPIWDDVEAIEESTESAIELTKTARDLADTMLSTEEDVEAVKLDWYLNPVIENARSTFDHAILTVDDGIPDVRVMGNDLLTAVFRNLVQNAIVHNDTDTPKVRISTTLDEETVTVAVADNGPSIPDGQKEEIFGKGEKGLDSSGTGIGLYLVRTLVEQYGGDVWVEDNEPEGSVFFLTLSRVE